MTSIAIDRTDGLQSAAAIKGPCRAATTANISLSGLQTVDGVSLVTADRVLVKDQTSGSENGIYVVDTGVWRRAKDFNKTRDVVKGTAVFVTDGAVNAETFWTVTTNNPIVVGTTSISFEIVIPPDESVGPDQITGDFIIRTVTTRTAMKALDTAKTTAAYLKEGGREGVFKWSPGDYSARVAADTLEGIYVKANAIVASSGAWVRQGGWALEGGYAEWFGAVADYDETDGSGTDNDAAINAALSLLPRVYLAGGDYRIANTVSGPAYRALVYANGAQSNPVGDDNYFSSSPRAFLVPRNLPRAHTINSMITQCELSGGLLANPSAAESYTSSSSGRLANYRIMDFTNQNASGATRATQRAVSIAVKAARGFVMDGVSIRTTRANGNFVSDAADTDFGNQCDIGFLGENAFFGTLKNSVITWGFRDAAVLLITDDVTGDSPDYYPQTDRFFIDNCFIEGHCGFAVRGPDAVRISAVSATEIRVKWFKSHRFATTGAVEADGTNYTYSSLTYDGGTQELVFGGLSADPVAGGVAVGETLYRAEDVRTFGTGGVSVNNSFIRSISHPSLKPSTDGFFTDFFAMCGRNIELSGLGVRGIHFNNCYVHGREDISFFANAAADIYFNNCYHEAKFLSAGSGSSVSRFVALGLAAKSAKGIAQPIGNAGDIHFVNWSQTESGTDMRPTFRTSSDYGRFGTGSGVDDGLFEPSRTSNDAYNWATASAGTARTIRAPAVRGSTHPLQWFSNSGTIRASMDNDGRWGWGFGMDTEADYTHAFNFLYGGSTTVNAENASTPGRTVFRAANTAGSAEVGVESAGEMILRSNNISRMKMQANFFGPVTATNMDLGSSALPMRDMYGRSLVITDGMTAPSTITGFASIYIDTADGDLKVKFADGIVKTIVVDT
ncbi:hypothetical protein GOA97_19430 [Sinorhizobium meliloti]|nr:hypothetical protein [Sinorhizobium meliloti]MDW9656627.1 hypothetical protein [Sinorhizobium meliloti]MDW9916437.1 hypothetical protein [Sinorhizobium meliloti]MDW9939574.1 hypothetical protein [Sinorhizobium meliloti]MDW9945969.1 hypothetical protein [Sinorhizobium meliloti]